MLTKKDKVIGIFGLVIVATLLMIGRDVQLYHEGQTLHATYEQRLKQRKDRIAENKKIAKENHQAIAQTDLEPTYRDGKKVINDLFNWGTWNEYRHNMSALSKDFPVVAKNKDIDSKGMMAGTGNSPVSEVDVDSVATGVGAENNQVSFYVKQYLTYPDQKYEKDWYLCFEKSGKDLKLVGYYPLQRLGH